MDQSVLYDQKKLRRHTIIVAVISVLLTIAILLTFCVGAFACVSIGTVIYLLSEGVSPGEIILLTILAAALAIDQICTELEYNEFWIQRHTEAEIIAKYGKFDVRSEPDEDGEYYGEYRRDTDGANYIYTRIYFSEDGTVKRIYPKQEGFHKGG